MFHLGKGVGRGAFAKMPLKRPVDLAPVHQEEGTSKEKARIILHLNVSVSPSPAYFFTVRKELHILASTSIPTVPRRATREEHLVIVIVTETYCYLDYSRGLNPSKNRSVAP